MRWRRLRGWLAVLVLAGCGEDADRAAGEPLDGGEQGGAPGSGGAGGVGAAAGFAGAGGTAGLAGASGTGGASGAGGGAGNAGLAGASGAAGGAGQGGVGGVAGQGGAAGASGAAGAGSCDPDVPVYANAGLLEEPGTGFCRYGMADLGGFCIDIYEASLVEVLNDGSTREWSPYHHPPAGVRVRAESRRGAVPQAYIDGVTAEAACVEAGKRLCTDAEWLRACQGPGGTVYPYGDQRLPGECNDARAQHPAIEYFGTADAWIWSELGNACIDQLPDSLATTGAHGGCVTAEGVFDMMGNLHEWTADPAGTFRGGFYVDTRINGDGCLYATTAHDTGHWDYSTGFRCCAD